MIETIRKTNENANIFLSECPPRRDVNVKEVNNVIRNVARDYKINLIDTYNKFITKNGNNDIALIWRDGVHLTDRGTATLLKHYHNYV